MTKELIKEGSGPCPQRGQNVQVHCTGKLENGSKFWSTKDPGQTPFEFQIGLSKVSLEPGCSSADKVWHAVVPDDVCERCAQVIKGWDEGCLNMKKGEVANLKCSPDYAYGAAGFPAWGIPPNAVLIFEIEILNIR